MPSKWATEEVWLSALSVAEYMIKNYSTHTYYNKRGVLDAAYTAQQLERERRRFMRIKSSGEQEWQDRYDAQGT